MQELERGAVETDVLSDHCVIFDMMALIRSVKPTNLTFDEFADKIREAVVRKSMKATHIDALFDVYLPVSIKC